MGRDLNDYNGCICPERPNYLLLYLNLDVMISSENDYVYLEETSQTIQTRS